MSGEMPPKGSKRPRSEENLDGTEANAVKKASKYVGVSYDKRAGKWQAGIMIEGKRKHLGTFQDDMEAAKKYDETAVLHKKPLNFPGKDQEQATKEAAKGTGTRYGKGKSSKPKDPEVPVDVPSID